MPDTVISSLQDVATKFRLNHLFSFNHSITMFMLLQYDYIHRIFIFGNVCAVCKNLKEAADGPNEMRHKKRETKLH